MKTIILILILLIPFISEAAPTISGITGTPATNNSIVINGASFGTKSPAAPYFYADFNQGSIAPSSFGIHTTWDDGGSPFSYSTDCEPGRGGCIKSNIPCGSCALGINFSYWNTPRQKWYVHRRTKIDFNFLKITGGSQNWKIFRLWGANFTGPTDMYWSAGNVVVEPLSYGFYYFNNPAGNPFGNQGESMFPPANQWITEEFIVQASDIDVMNATDQVFYNGIYMNQPCPGCTNPTKAYETLTTADNNLWVLGFIVHQVGASINDGSWSPPYPAQGITAWDDNVYMDSTWSRVIIGDQNTLAASSHREIQIPSAWADGSLTVKWNSGTFSTGNAVYIYVCDSNNVCNATGFQVNVAAPSNAVNYALYSRAFEVTCPASYGAASLEILPYTSNRRSFCAINYSGGDIRFGIGLTGTPDLTGSNSKVMHPGAFICDQTPGVFIGRLSCESTTSQPQTIGVEQITQP